ncbi:D-alanyl-D-alanine carboxypeptidase/D-alanyl-D-alanine endopeptidase [Corynebacterium halotolerans]|uniref:D-alanyl-D-alanine carboxypeptidase n=1 Tax=Corynebacterium halotolerans YIM 70093 = DSM 44683 TaxID=1121362 RepID=M1NPZ4_9CORY|nr:D-alanyl-D-alanine carboxypeptidase/D-alanyl-D-alanine-endopeptidase [Corynebacterium halotolerans]AGF73453.1 D-alanyl-D-alanine carboxypeptidase [Corynebacterium halotolerans YIM 70093 = DSM 44683]
MRFKKLWWGVTAGVTAVAVAAVAGVGVLTQQRYADLEHAPAYAVERPEPKIVPAGAEDGVDNAALAAELTRLAADPALGTLHGQVTDTVTGEVVWSESPDEPLLPASSTKILTAAAAMLELDPVHRLTTEVVAGDVPGSVVIRASGDVWLTEEQIDDLAEQVGQADTVFIDTSVWSGPALMEGWDAADIDGGYVAPMEPAMLHGARIGATEGDVPRSHTPALDVAQALADRVGADTVGEGSAPPGAEVLASTESEVLAERVEDMMVWSDNVMAEAIGREIAIHRGHEPSAEGATTATLEVLAEHGFDTTGVTLNDNSGLSTGNRIPPRLLDDILHTAATAEGEELRPILAALPVAGGTGTLMDRYQDMSGRGWVRAKTGTLTGTSALAGVVTADSGRVYSFGLLSNDSAILPARAALDNFASTIRES